MTPETMTVHVDDLGDVEVTLIDPSSPCPTCGTPGEAVGWRILTIVHRVDRSIDVFRCPTCSTACAVIA